jgi:hypothetical protein
MRCSLHARSGWLVAAGVAVALVAGCGGSSGNASKSPATNSNEAVEAAVGLDPIDMQRRQLQVEGLIADCMKAKGFDYVPLDPTAAALPGASPGQVVIVQGLSEDEFRNLYGYGRTTLYDAKAGATKGLIENPNAKIRDALSPADQAAYDKALTGGSSAGTFAFAVDEGDFSTLGGCNKEAAEKVFGSGQALEEVQTALDEIDTRVAADKRFLEAVRNWSTCMNDAGHQYDDPDQLEESLVRKLNVIVGPPSARKATYDTAALVALQGLELQVAKVDHDCQTKYLTDVDRQVESDVQKAYLAAHPELSQLGN